MSVGDLVFFGLFRLILNSVGRTQQNFGLFGCWDNFMNFKGAQVP